LKQRQQEQASELRSFKSGQLMNEASGRMLMTIGTGVQTQVNLGINYKYYSNYDSSARYYDYGMTFEANRVHFMIVANGVTHTLWDYWGPSNRVPGQPMHFMHNVWHTDNWYPMDDNGSAVETPKYPVNVYIDTSSFTPLNN
jgi:hypothetical protein